jgi:uncharacterized membrane protein
MTVMGKETNLNTILIAVLLGVSGWVAFKTSETGEKVSALVEAKSTNDRELLDLRQRMAAVEIKLAQIEGRGAAK